jgi:hypothetical protein
MNIQAAIDALPAIGGIINIPAGDHPGPPLKLRSYVILQGSGLATRIPYVVNGTNTVRIYHVWLRDLLIEGAVTTTTGYNLYGMDWRNISSGGVHNVRAFNCDYGMVCSFSSLYNQFSCFSGEANVCGAEFYNGANHNSLRDGKLSAPKGLNINGCNGTLVDHVSLEWSQPNMVFKTITGDDGLTKAIHVRQEDANHNSTYWNQ